MRNAASHALLLCLLATFTVGGRGNGQEAGPRIYHGSVESAPGSPVMLSDARFSMASSDSQAGAVKLAARVKIDNVSGKRIKTLVFGFRHISDDIGNYTHIEEYRGLDPVASVDFVEDASSVSGATSQPISVSVMATGALFADGSYWAAPRSSPRLLFSACVSTHSGAGVNITTCKLAARH